MQTILATCTLVVLCATAAFAANAKAGQAIFDKSCKSCHGADGTPNAAVAKMMKVDMKDLKSTEVQSLSDDDMKKIITEGKDKMKPATNGRSAAVNENVAGFFESSNDFVGHSLVKGQGRHQDCLDPWLNTRLSTQPIHRPSLQLIGL